MTFNEFITAHTDQDAVFPDCPLNSCMALMHLYLQEVLNLDNPATLGAPIAADVWTNFGSLTGSSGFTQIANTPEGVPSVGDIVVFGANPEVGIPEGHICIFHDGDANQFNSFDSNFPTGSKPHIQNHSYTDVAGWLHFTGNTSAEVASGEIAAPADNTYKGLDLTNTDSVKAAIDTWDEVANQGLFVRKTDEEAALASKDTQISALTSQLQTITSQFETLQSAHNELVNASGKPALTDEQKQGFGAKLNAFLDELQAELNKPL